MTYNSLAMFFMFSLAICSGILIVIAETIKRINTKENPRVFALVIGIFILVCLYAEITIMVTSTMSGGFHNRYLHDRIEHPSYERTYTTNYGEEIY